MEKVMESHGISKAQKSTNPGGGGGELRVQLPSGVHNVCFFPFCFHISLFL